MLDIISGVISPVILLLGGAFFTVRLRGFALLHPIRFLRTLKDSDGGLSGLSLALAGTLGVGNIVGVVNALRFGGAGAVFWMWVCALLASYLKYAEAYFAVKYRRRDGTGVHGGAYYYIKKAFSGRLGRTLSVIFCLGFFGNTLATGCAMQASAAVDGITTVLPLPKILISAAITVAVAWAVVFGIKHISKLTSVLVPIMTAVYLALSLTVIFMRAESLPNVFASIWEGAFSMRGALFGIGSFCFTEAMRCGVMRGLLSNEAGCGSSATAHATEENASPHRQGCMGIAEVSADTLIMCTVTALAVLCTGADPARFTTDVLCAVESYAFCGGRMFAVISALCIATFGYASLICFAGYGGECLHFLLPDGKIKKAATATFLAVYFLTTLASPYLQMDTVLVFADLSMSIMAFINVPALIRLSFKEKFAPIP